MHSHEEIDLPVSLGKINNRVFKGCKNLKQKTIPNEINYSGEYIFSVFLSL